MDKDTLIDFAAGVAGKESLKSLINCLPGGSAGIISGHPLDTAK